MNQAFQFFSKTFLNLVQISVILCGIATIFGFLGEYFWLFDLFSHFRIQYLIVAAVCACILYYAGKSHLGMLSIIIIIFNFCQFYQYYIPKEDNHTPPEISVLTYNVFTNNDNYKDVIEAIHSSETDIVFLMEVNQAWITKLRILGETYPYKIIQAREDNFGVALYSKYPLEKQQIKYFSDVPSIFAKIQIGQKSLNIIGTHPVPPASRFGTKSRNKHLSSLASFSNNLENEVLIMGDLNTTPFSFAFQKLLKDANFTDSAIGFGLSPTWSQQLPIFAIAIDHILVSKNTTVIERTVGKSFGSDHSMVMAKLAFD